jgi:hypothetical protein
MSTSIALNTGPCRVSHCTGQRLGVSPYCRAHTKRAKRTGHPLGRGILRSEYGSHLARVVELFGENADHQGLQAAQRLIRSLLERAAAGDATVAGAAELARLHRAGVQPREILAAVSAVFVYAHANPHRLSDDARLDYAMAHAAMQLSPRGLKTTRSGKTRSDPPRPSDVKALGSYLRQVLIPFLVNVRHALASRVEQERSLVEQLREPLRPPLVALLEAQAKAGTQ